MIVSNVSGSEETTNVGSSSDSRFSATPIFSWSCLVLGSTRTATTGAGKVMVSSRIGASTSHRVCDVFTSLIPTAAAISPAYTSSTSSRLSAISRTIRPTRSLLPVEEFIMYVPDFIVPEYTRKNASCPTNLSSCSLNTSALIPSSSEGFRVRTVSSSLGSVPCVSGRSSGDGR